MSFRDTQNPGIGGLDELTLAEELVIQSMTSFSGNGGKFLRVNVGETGVEYATAGGSGTVTSVSIVTANGVSGSVATSTTTPAITLTLGAITPSSVQISGLTASQIVGTDASKNLVSLAVATYPSLTELTYVKGVTSDIQTQINGKQISMGADDNYVTDAEKVVIGNTSGTNTGDNTVATALTGTPSITVATVTTTGNLELGNASDTTVSRSAAGVIAVEGVVIPSISSTNTLTNKRVTKRTDTTTSHATPTINTDNVDFYSLTAQAEAITSFTTNLSGTPTENQTLWIAITGTAARAITWGASFEASTVALPTTTVTTARLDVGFVWNTVTSKWRCVASA